MTGLRIRRPLLAFAAVLVATVVAILGAVAPARAQSVWLDRERENTIQLEILKPDPDGNDNLTFGSSVWYLSGRFAFNPKVHGLVEVPFATSGIDGAGPSFDDETGWVGGNPYAGIEVGSSTSPVLGEIGIRVPLAGTKFVSSLLGLYSDTERWPAWLGDEVTTIRAGMHVRSRPSSEGLWFDGRIAPEFLFGSDDSEVWMTYGAALRCTRPKLRAGASFSGRAFLDDLTDEFGLSTLHELDLAADYGNWKLRPGVTLTVPIDEDLNDELALIYGLSLSYAP